MDSTRAARQILDTIRSEGAISRTGIAKVTGLSLAAVSDRVEALLNQKMVMEVGFGPSQGGRRPQLIVLNTKAAYVIAIDLGATNVKVGISDLGLNLVDIESTVINVADGPEPVLDRIKTMVYSLLERNSIERAMVKGIGMGVPGPVEFETGLPTSPPIMPGWDRYPIRTYWAKHFDCPCLVDNDVNIMAIGEHVEGCGRGVDNLLFVKIGTGIGSGIICNGEIYRGCQGAAGDIGHIDVGRDDVVCWCGHRGCLEALAGGRAIGALAEKAARDGRSAILASMLAEKGELTAADVGLAAERMDLTAIELVRQSGLLVGGVLASLVNFFNHNLIVVGGGVSELGDRLSAAIKQAVYHRSLPLATRHLVIKQSTLGHKAGLVGAAVMAVEKVLLETGNAASLAVTHKSHA